MEINENRCKRKGTVHIWTVKRKKKRNATTHVDGARNYNAK